MKKIFLLLLLCSCGENGTDESVTYSGGAGPSENMVVTFEILKKEVLDPQGCTGCHDGGSGGPDWSNGRTFEEGVLSRVNDERNLESPLYARSADDMNPMPPFIGPVNKSGLEYIQRFIEGLD